MEKLGQESQALGQAIYEATQAEQAAGASAPGGGYVAPVAQPDRSACMKAEDLLPEHLNQGVVHGVTLRKGTIGAFLVNATAWLAPGTAPDERAALERDIVEVLPVLRAIGLFDVLEARDPRLRALVARVDDAPP